jgi:membrane protein
VAVQLQQTVTAAREVVPELVRQVRRHDLVFYAAGLTFYAAIAVVPLLLVAWFVTSLVLGGEVVRTLTTTLAAYAPTSLGLREGVRSLGEVGPGSGSRRSRPRWCRRPATGTGWCGRWTGSPSGTGGPRGCGGGCWGWCSWPRCRRW